MDEIEVSELLKKLMVLFNDKLAQLEESDEYKALAEEMESLDKNAPDYEEKKKIADDKALIMEQSLKSSVLEGITDEQKIDILMTISPTFISENKLPVSSFSPGVFEDILVSIISSLSDYSIFNNLISSDNFIDGLGYSPYIISSIIQRVTSQDKVLEFFQKYRQGFSLVNLKSDTIVNAHNSDLGMALSAIFNNSNLANDFKINLLFMDDTYLFLDDYYLVEILKSECLSKEERLKLLGNEKIYSRLSNYYFSLVLASVTTSYDDIKDFLQNEILANKIDIGNFVSNLKLESKEYKKVLEDEHVFAKIDWLSLERILKDSEMAYEDRVEILFDDKFFSMLNGIAVADIMCSKHFTAEQRIGLLKNEKISNLMFQDSNYLPKLFEIGGIPLQDRIAILQDEYFYPKISSPLIEGVFASPDADLDVCTNLLFNKNLFYRLINEYHPIYNPECVNKGPFKYDKYEYLTSLYQENPQIARTISVDLLDDDLLDLGFDFIQKMTKYPRVAHNLASSLTYGNFDFIKNMIAALQKMEHVDEINIAEFVSKIIEANNDKSYYSPDPGKATSISKIMYNSNVNFSKLNEEDWKTLMEITFRDGSFYNKGIIRTIFGNTIIPVDISLNIMPEIKTVEDLRNFEESRISLCDEAFYSAFNNGDLDKAKNAYFNKFFSINLDEAKQINRMYNTSLSEMKSMPEYTKVTNYLSRISKALSVESLDALSSIFNSENDILSFEDRIFMDQFIRQMFSQNMSDSVFKTENATLTHIEVLEDGVAKQIPVYEAGLDFKMLIHSTAAYGQMQLVNDNYFDSWNKSSRKTNHGICCSLIASDNLGMAAVNDVLLGFDSWAPGAVSKSAPYDIYSMNDGYNIEEGRALTFMSASDIINNTRHTHNEQVLERLELRDDKRTDDCQNIQPSYVIIYNDMPDEIKLKAVKCSKELNIPIVYIDKEKIVKNEVAKIDALIQKLGSSLLFDEKIPILEQILVSHENNRSGLRMTNPDMVNQYFPTDKITKLFEMLIAEIKRKFLSTGDVANYEKYANMLLDILDRENNKFVTTSEVSERLNVIDIPIQDLRKSIMGVIDKSLDEFNVPKIGAIKSDAISKHSDTAIGMALAKADISLAQSMISRAMEQGFYNENLPLNNVGHIERTAVLANLIGKREFTNENGVFDQRAMEMLMTAVLYHDCSKENDYKDPRHGKKSAQKMLEAISGMSFTDDEKKILSIVVEFHDDPNLKDKFTMICDRSGLTTEQTEYAQKIAFALQDANFLDRGPRSPMGELMLEFDAALHFESSKELSDIADTLRKYYGTIDRVLFTNMCNNMVVSLEQEQVQEVTETQGRKS